MGGGVMRTAAKLASSTKTLFPPLVGEAGRRAAGRPTTSSYAPAIEPGQIVPSISSVPPQTEPQPVSIAARWPDWECDEWEFAGDTEGSFESADVIPRLVFGPAPTIEEAKEATTDLKDVLEKMCFAPDHIVGSHGGGHATSYGESGVVSVVPRDVAQMFSLLKESSEAQDVVSSIAADKNVWNAVMKNEKFIQFCMNPSPVVTQIYEEPAESVGESKTEFLSTTDKEKPSEGFVEGLWNSTKVKVSQAIGNISEYFQDIFGISSPSGEKATSSTDDSYFNSTFGRTLQGIALLVIMLILFKRLP